ncbi:uncharacterized protein LOC135710241 [Ochlerotatus camptorhynchus]|uniref:uncharacterized protein LOC135710241 n=1 Tax=Ochlerotatus camptorhynchus TaxID=644619 RepID=UPI0031D31F10
MFTTIFGILKNSGEPVPLNRISNALLDHHPEVASKSQNLEREILKHLETGRKFGLISGSDKGFKLSVDLNKREDALFHSRLHVVQEDLDALGAEPFQGPSDSVNPVDHVRRSQTPTLDQVRPPVVRRVSTIRRRMAAQDKDRVMMRTSRQRGRSPSQPRSGSRPRTPTRSQSRTHSRTRSRSSRSRGQRH